MKRMNEDKENKTSIINETVISKLRKRAIRRNSSDSADGNIIAFMILMPFVFFLILSAIDVGMYFTNTNNIRNAAMDSAQQAASVAGTGSISNISNLERSFGNYQTRSQLAAGVPGLPGLNIRNTPEWNVVTTLDDNESLYRVVLDEVTCAVDNGTGGGDIDSGNYVHDMSQRTYCRVEWQYDGLPLSVFGVFVGNEPRMTTASVPAEVVIGTPYQAYRDSRPN